jgi:D-glycero-D-manno-heptose 1,7-bisphosphate phosphatase
MGRYSIETSIKNPQQNLNFPADWPTQFNKQTIGIDRNGVIVRSDRPIIHANDIQLVDGSTEAIRMMRLKGYKVFIFFNEPLISQGKTTQYQVDATNQRLMDLFGQSGIFSIDGLLYSTTNSKEDSFALPNTGMLKKAESELGAKFKGGYFVGNKIYDLKAANNIGAKPILIKNGEWQETEKKLATFANRDLKSKTVSYDSLLDFANSLS